MPLFMDLHKASDYEIKPTVEEIRRNHIADLEVQHKYGVKFLQYWINEDAGLVFCLMEAPDKESCAAVHQEAHGNMPCNVIELQGGDYSAFTFTGDATRINEFDIVERADGSLDTGYRMILVFDFLSLTENDLLLEEIDLIVKNAGGHFLNRPINRKTIVFMPGSQAVKCAIDIIERIQHPSVNTSEARIGISAGEPVTKKQDVFADAIQLANQLCDIAHNGQVVISSLAKELTEKNKHQKHKQSNFLKMLNPDDEHFMDLFIKAINSLPETSLNIDGLGKHLGMSRSGLYRKIKDLTGRPANSFIQELRMQKAFHLIRNKYGNITQVALEAGFNNLSYFSKSFQKRFGVLPLKAAKLNS